MYDFSLGNHNVPAPAEVNEAVKDIVDNEESTFIQGYMSNAGYEDVRQTIAESLNRRFGTHFLLRITWQVCCLPRTLHGLPNCFLLKKPLNQLSLFISSQKNMTTL